MESENELISWSSLWASMKKKGLVAYIKAVKERLHLVCSTVRSVFLLLFYAFCALYPEMRRRLPSAHDK